MYLAKIHVTPKKSVLDPQGVAISQALHTMGFPGVDSVRMGKYLEMKLDGKSKDKVHQEVDSMCKKLLANMVIEQYDFDLEKL
jgi:phosphoribosylformylglycinamidine synthase